jgi:hypothetical protein
VRSRTSVLISRWFQLSPLLFISDWNTTHLKLPWHSGAARSLSNLGDPYLPPNLQVLCDLRFYFLDSTFSLPFMSPTERKVWKLRFFLGPRYFYKKHTHLFFFKDLLQARFLQDHSCKTTRVLLAH